MHFKLRTMRSALMSDLGCEISTDFKDGLQVLGTITMTLSFSE